jgi:hypothetical protein
MNLPVIILISIGALALIIFLVKRNIKDEKDFEHQLNSEYPKPRDEAADAETDEVTK